MTKTDLTGAIKSWLQGDEKAFTGLFYYYHAQLTRFSVKFIQDQQLVEELVMNVLLRIWKSRDRITSPATFNAYLYSAMRNEIISYFRRKKMILAPLETADKLSFVNTEYEYRALLAAYGACIEKLPLKRRQIFLMSHREGMTYSQIAQELNISLNTVQKQVGAALKTIRKELDLPGMYESMVPVIFLVLLSLLC